ncbi:hypothetical protein BEN71_00590 (plasmid) [Acinetobacter wuhouensis]|jgi:di/tricarboxylate transporter|nr:hypothetical protein BEN71_00590 [Acinetobacter wuhouensis]
MKKRSTKARSNIMQLKQVLGKIKDIIFGVIAAPLLIIIMMLASILDQRAFKKERNRKKEQDKT